MALCEHWNYEGGGKDFHGGYAFMSLGPLPAAWAATQTGNHGLWGQAIACRTADRIVELARRGEL